MRLPSWGEWVALSQDSARGKRSFLQREQSFLGVPHMAGIFAKAAAKAKETAKEVKKKGVAWLVGGAESESISKAVHELTMLAAQMKALEAKQGIIKSAIKRYCDDMFVRDYVARESMPDSPMSLINADGDKVSYVCQDRGGQYGLKPEQLEALEDLLGADAVGNITYNEQTFSFNREIMSMPGVQEAIGESIETAMMSLVDCGTLTPLQAESLLDVKDKTSFRPGTLDRLTAICGRDSNKVKQFLDISGSSFTRYVKV